MYVECVLRIGLFIICSLVFVFIIIVLILERFIKISNLYIYWKYVSIKWIRIGFIIVWMMLLIVGLLLFFGWSFKNVFYLCSFFCIMLKFYIIFVLIIYVIFFFCILCVYLWMVIVVCCYVIVIRYIWGIGRGWNRGGFILWVVMIILIVVGVYFLCWVLIGKRFLWV